MKTLDNTGPIQKAYTWMSSLLNGITRELSDGVYDANKFMESIAGQDNLTQIDAMTDRINQLRIYIAQLATTDEQGRNRKKIKDLNQEIAVMNDYLEKAKNLQAQIDAQSKDGGIGGSVVSGTVTDLSAGTASIGAPGGGSRVKSSELTEHEQMLNQLEIETEVNEELIRLYGLKSNAAASGAELELQAKLNLGEITQEEYDINLKLLETKNALTEAELAHGDALNRNAEIMTNSLDTLNQLANSWGSLYADGVNTAINETMKLVEINQEGTLSVNDTLSAAANVAGAMASNLDQDSAAYKAFAIIQATIATYLGATQVLADEKLPTMLKAGLAGAVIGMGLANVAQIASAKDGWSNVGSSSVANNWTGYANGTSSVSGPGTSKSDSIPTMLSRGEAVLTNTAAESLGRANIEAMNAGRMPDMGGGGNVTIEAPLIIQGNVDDSTMAPLTDYQQQQVKAIATSVSDNRIRFQKKAGGMLSKAGK